jgi:hypothetical protein
MALVFADRVQETSTTTGTGTFSLLGASVGYQSFASGVGDGNTCYYCIAGQPTSTDPSEWEVGLGTYTASGSTLSRTTILSSSNSGAAVNFSAGTKNVFVTFPALWAQDTYNGTFGNLSSSGTVSGTGFINYFASPPAIGSTTPGTGSFTTLMASSTVSGAGFSAYLASPPTIGNTTPNEINGTYISAVGPISATSNVGAFSFGTLGYSDTQVFSSYTSSVNNYNQMVLQNTNSGNTASTNFNVSNDQATAGTYYGEFGMNSSTFSGTGAFNTPGMVYLASSSTDLAIGTYGAGAIHFVVNSGSTDAATISAAGVFTIPTLATGLTGYLYGNGSSAVTSSTTIPGTAISGNISGSAGSVANALTINNSGTGATSGSTFNGSTALTISYNTVGAPSTTGSGASGTWGISISGNAATATTATSASSATTATTATNATNIAVTGGASTNASFYPVFVNGSSTGNFGANSVSTLNFNPSTGVMGSTTFHATNGLLSDSAYTGAYTDGIVIDYSSGNGRISAGAADTITLYTGGVANTQMAQFSTTGMNNTAIGATTTSTGAFTTLSASSTVTFSGGTANAVLYLNGSKVATTGSNMTFDGTNFTSQMKAYKEYVTANTSVSTTYTVDLSTANIFALTLTGNTTFSFTNPAATGTSSAFTMIITQDSTGSRTGTWPASVKWPGGSTPVLSTGANKTDILNFITVNGGTTYYGSLSLANM